MLKARKWLNFPIPPVFEAPAWRNPLECWDEIWQQKTRIMGLPEGEGNHYASFLRFDKAARDRRKD